MPPHPAHNKTPRPFGQGFRAQMAFVRYSITNRSVKCLSPTVMDTRYMPAAS